MDLKDAERVAGLFFSTLAPVCERIAIVGSVRRKKPNPKDVELLCVPRRDPYTNTDMLEDLIDHLIVRGILAKRPLKSGRQSYGHYNKLLVHVPTSTPVDIFTTDEKKWWMALVIRTGPKDSNIYLAMTAEKKGWKLRAYGAGYDTPGGPHICQSEAEVFEVLGLPHLPPEKRNFKWSAR